MDNNEEKRDKFCRGCLKRIEKDNYYKRKETKDKIHHFCKDCEKEKGWNLEWDKLDLF